MLKLFYGPINEIRRNLLSEKSQEKKMFLLKKKNFNGYKNAFKYKIAHSRIKTALHKNMQMSY